MFRPVSGCLILLFPNACFLFWHIVHPSNSPPAVHVHSVKIRSTDIIIIIVRYSEKVRIRSRNISRACHAPTLRHALLLYLKVKKDATTSHDYHPRLCRAQCYSYVCVGGGERLARCVRGRCSRRLGANHHFETEIIVRPKFRVRVYTYVDAKRIFPKRYISLFTRSRTYIILVQMIYDRFQYP